MKKVFVSAVLCFMLALGLAFAQSGGVSGGASGGASGGFGGVSGGSGGVTTSTGNSIADELSSNPQFSTFVSLLQQAGLFQTLQGTTTYTVFAPTNDAFDALPAGQLSALKSNTTQLAQVLNYSIVAGEKSASDLATTNSLTTLQGGTLNITGVAGQVASGGAMSGGVSGGMSGGVSGQAATSLKVNSASITGSPMSASNGIIYAVDTVLMPTGVSLSGGASGGISGGVGMSGGISISGGASGGASGGF